MNFVYLIFKQYIVNIFMSTMQNMNNMVYFLLNYDMAFAYGSYSKLLGAIRQSVLPTDLLMIKFFEYCTFKGKTVEEIYAMFIEDNNNGTNDEGHAVTYPTIEQDIESIQKLMTIVNDRHTVFRPTEENMNTLQMQRLTKELEKYCKNNSVVQHLTPHEGYPLPDPKMGRPRLTWCVCRFDKCGKSFASPTELVAHLEKCNVYTQGFHWDHEMAVRDLMLTPEKVIEKNICECPSYACNHKSFNSPSELIHHLQVLGIEPFWREGMIVGNMKSIGNADLLCHNPKLFSLESCVICLSDDICIISGECRHHLYCADCFLKAVKPTNNICPICRSKINKFYPFA
jgi:hypothetical protein